MSVASSQLTKGAVTLKGSAQLVSDFFNYGINSILYQRGIYPAESFTRKEEYGLTLLVSTDQKVKQFLESVLSQIKVIPYNLNDLPPFYVPYQPHFIIVLYVYTTISKRGLYNMKM